MDDGESATWQFNQIKTNRCISHSLRRYVLSLNHVLALRSFTSSRSSTDPSHPRREKRVHSPRQPRRCRNRVRPSIRSSHLYDNAMHRCVRRMRARSHPHLQSGHVTRTSVDALRTDGSESLDNN